MLARNPVVEHHTKRLTQKKYLSMNANTCVVWHGVWTRNCFQRTSMCTKPPATTLALCTMCRLGIKTVRQTLVGFFILKQIRFYNKLKGIRDPMQAHSSLNRGLVIDVAKQLRCVLALMWVALSRGTGGFALNARQRL